MPRTHRPYDQALRQQAVELLLSSGKTQREVACDLGISPDTLHDWKQQHEQKLARVSVGPRQDTALDLNRENLRLRQELAYVQRQRDILKKALATHVHVFEGRSLTARSNAPRSDGCPAHAVAVPDAPPRDSLWTVSLHPRYHSATVRASYSVGRRKTTDHSLISWPT